MDTTAGAWRAAERRDRHRALRPRDRAAASPRRSRRDVVQVVPTALPQSRCSSPRAAVLVVGASSTGIQLASEIARSGRPVTLAVGGHTRLPRQYRGLDIMAWLDAMGVLSESADQVWDVAASREEPSLQLIGDDGHRSLDLGVLQAEGVRVVGRVLGVPGGRSRSRDDLARVGRARRDEDAPTCSTAWTASSRRGGLGGSPPGARRPAARAGARDAARPSSTSERQASGPCSGRPATAASTRGSACPCWTATGELRHEGGDHAGAGPLRARALLHAPPQLELPGWRRRRRRRPGGRHRSAGWRAAAASAA